MKVFQRKLKKDKLLEKILKYRDEANYNAEDYYEKFFEIIEEEFAKSSFVSDSDFLVLGRRKFLIEEFHDVLNGKLNAPSDNPFYFALGNLTELLYCDSPLHGADNSIENRKKQQRNYRRGVVCLEEKQIIEELIKEFRIKLEESRNK